MELTKHHLGHPITILLANKKREVIFCGWFLESPMVQLLNDDGYLSGEVHVIKPAHIVDVPPLIGEPPAIYCPPHPNIDPYKH
ncbi:MAG: hypothetical protein CMF25_04145 [Kangiellaceae bacterium]|jgi:hypothetical protein|nr:hypothetical protein [Kangiellaceae bacterium]|tara:strand:- start:10906 stop:11154 length:249 start_codon:yes stop_codon:yes gene_type:complete